MPAVQTKKQIGSIVDGIVLALIALAVVGCKVGPNYKRPAVDVPQTYRGALAPDIAPASATPASLAEEQWSSIFQDATLQRLIREALANNLDLHIAAQRVLEAQAQAGIARSQQLPSVSGGGSYSALQIPSSLAGNNSNGTPPTLSSTAEAPAHPPHGISISGDSIVARPKQPERISWPVSGEAEPRGPL